MALDKTHVIPDRVRDTIDELRRELKSQPILGIKKRLAFITNVLQEIGLPEQNGYYLLSHLADYPSLHTHKANSPARNSPASSAINQKCASDCGPIRWIRLLASKKEYILGRDPASTHLTLSDPFVSKIHCRFVCDSNGWKVVDLNSRNGVRVNYNLTEKKYLHNGDLIGLSSTTTLIFINTLLLNSSV